jgi:hypothetical protein
MIALNNTRENLILKESQKSREMKYYIISYIDEDNINKYVARADKVRAKQLFKDLCELKIYRDLTLITVKPIKIKKDKVR